MQIYLNNKLAAIKKGSSFEYISENRLFSGSDDYTLSISFPLKDCPMNIDIFGNINRADISVKKVIFDCEIRDKALIKVGTAVVTEISDTEVKCQFLEGRSEQNYDNYFNKVFINQLELGEGPTRSQLSASPEDAWNPEFSNFTCVALPWINNSSESGLSHNFAKPVVNSDSFSNIDHWEWDNEDTSDLTWQPYLIYVTKKIFESLGYSCNFSEWENHRGFKYIVICNVLPSSWELYDFSNALPAWTVEEFMYKLELFLGGEFLVDHRNKTISFSFIRDILKDSNTVYISDVVNELTKEEDIENNGSEYLESKNLYYKTQDWEIWKYLSCRWYIDRWKTLIVEYDSLANLIDENKGYRQVSKREDVSFSVRGNSLSKILYAKDVNTYFIIKPFLKGIGNSVDGVRFYNYYMNLQPINIFGERLISDKEDWSSEEIEIVPACIDFIPQLPDSIKNQRYKCIYVSPGSFSEGSNSGSLNEDGIYDTTRQQDNLLRGSAENSGEYYDTLYLAYWDGSRRESSRMPFPEIEDIYIKSDWSGFELRPFNFRLTGFGSFHDIVNKIDTQTKVTFRFLSNKIPEVKSIFNIRGKRYICEKLTATFTENGMSQLIKGVFYPLID